MKRKIVQEEKSFSGTYEFYLDDIEQIAAMLQEAYGSFSLEIDDYELDSFQEVAGLNKEEANYIRLQAPADVLTRTLGVRIGTSRLYLVMEDKYDYKAIGVATEITKRIEARKVEGANETKKHPFDPTRCSIHLYPNPKRASIRRTATCEPTKLASVQTHEIKAVLDHLQRWGEEPLPDLAELTIDIPNFGTSAPVTKELQSSATLQGKARPSFWRRQKENIIAKVVAGLIVAALVTAVSLFWRNILGLFSH